MRRGLLLLMCCLVPPAQAEEALSACLNLARQQTPIAVELAQDCPALFAELQGQKLLAAFGPPLQEASLAQLEFLAYSYQNLRMATPISQDGLGPLLAGILETKSQDPESAWWQAFLKWLDSLKGGDYEAQYQWLRRLLQAMQPSGQTVLFFIYGSMALLVIASAWLVVSELYAAGCFVKLTGKRQARRKHGPELRLQASAAPLTRDGLPPHRQIAVLLGQVIDKLAEREAIPDDVTLTYRQVACHLQRQGLVQAAAFARLVQIAEPVLYGARPVDAQTLSQYRHDAQALLAGLLS